MKKITHIVLGLWNVVNVVTFADFTYRYVWYSTTTVPTERALAVAGLLIASISIWLGFADFSET